MTAASAVKVVMNGVTGRMGTTQHLLRSVLPIREQGGVALASGDRVMLEPVLVGRNEEKLRRLSAAHGIEHWTTDLGQALEDPEALLYFDAQATAARPAAVRRAIGAGKHVYTEKPVAGDLRTALELASLAAAAGVKSGVVQDKLYLPGVQKLRRLVRSGFFGRVLSAKCDFGYWVFEGGWQPAQRPTWNYRAEAGGGIVSDMFPHWSYVFEDLLGPLESLTCTVATHIDERIDEHGEVYSATADDAAYAILEVAGGIVAQVNSSWCTRVRRDDLMSLQVDGTHGSAVAGLHRCVTQHRAQTPRPVWDPDTPSGHDYYADWAPVPDNTVFANAFKAQWELFVRHVFEDAPCPGLLEGARGVQLAEAALQSAREGRTVPLRPLSLDSESGRDSPCSMT